MAGILQNISDMSLGMRIGDMTDEHQEIWLIRDGSQISRVSFRLLKVFYENNIFDVPAIETIKTSVII